VGYLRSFPNGRFAEIAQLRLARLLAEDEKLAAEKRQREEQRQAAENKRIEQASRSETVQAAAVQSPAPATAASPAPGQAPRPAAAATAAEPVLDIQAGAAVPMLIAPSANPFSAGRYPLGRIYSVGDTAVIRQSDYLTGVEERTVTVRVTRVDPDADRVEYNDGRSITDLMGNFIKNGPIEFDSPVQFSPAEFQVGKKWTAAFRRTLNGSTSNNYFDLHITRRETITVPAGSFDCFRIEGQGWNMTAGAQLEVNLWLVPGLNFSVRREFVARNRMGRFGQTERHELVSLRQHAIGRLS
jgi:hypothetical protein